MQRYLNRMLADKVKARLREIESVAIIGPRQVGKSTMAKSILKEIPGALYLDLERGSDIEKLRDPETFFAHNAHRLVCLDEIQRMPDLFPLLRSVMDENGTNGQFLLLGSASPDLIKSSSETLAGRIAYLDLSPFTMHEVANAMNCGHDTRNALWLKGGFPKSFLANNEYASFEWRLDFISTFLERDLSMLGVRIPPVTLQRFWKMMAHSNGEVLNASKLGASLGVSNHTVTRYIAVLEHTFMLRILPAYSANLKKRLVKSPKVYIADTGILHALLDIENFNDLMGHPVCGSSWESFALQAICAHLPRWRKSFFRTSSGNELDLILERGNRMVAVEFKASAAPKIAKGTFIAMNDLQIDECFVIAPIKDDFKNKNIKFVSINSFINKFREKT